MRTIYPLQTVSGWSQTGVWWSIWWSGAIPISRIKDGALTIEATTKTENDQKDEDGKYLRRERFQGTCTRSFFVGEHLTEEDIKAKFDGGVLTVNVPKKEAKPQIEEKKYIQIEG